MAEIANKRTEECLPEFEELSKLDLFSPEQLRFIIQKHKDYEYKIRRRGKSDTLFFKFIDYKLQLLQLCRIRMKKQRIEPSQKIGLQNLIRKDIKRLFRHCTKFFPFSIAAWNKYIDFLTSEKLYAEALIVFNLMLAYHSEPEVYIKAAKFASKKCFSINRARQFLFKGIRAHKNEKKLYLSLFKLELRHVSEKWKDFQDDKDVINKDPVLLGLSAEAVFISAAEIFCDMNFMFSFFKISQKYTEYLPKLPLTIYREIKRRYSDNSEMWYNIAMLQLSGIDCESDENQITLTKSKKLKVKKCLRIYGLALEKYPTDELWISYINTLFIIRHTKGKLKFVKTFFHEMMNTQSVKKRIKPSHYISWMTLLESEDKSSEFIHVAEIALDTFPSNPDVYTKKIEFHMKKFEKEEIIKTFYLAKVKLNGNSLDMIKVWKSTLNALSNFPEIQVEKMLEELLKCSSSQLVELKPPFFEWVIKTGNVTKIKEVFKVLKQAPPYELSLFIKMIEVLRNCSESYTDEIRCYFEEACHHFGSISSDLWLDYVKFEHSTDRAGEISLLYWRAVKQLEPAKSDIFIKEYCLWKTQL